MRKELSDIVRRLEKLESAVFESKKSKSKQSKIEPNNDSLGGLIINLRDSGFFKQPKMAPEVREKLKSTYPCEPDRITTALLRLRKKGLLRLTSKEFEKRKMKAYVW